MTNTESQEPADPDHRRFFLRKIILPTLGLAALVGVFYAVENMRGRNAWNSLRAEREALGESFNWNDHVPQPIPDADNMLKDPLIEDWFVKETDLKSWFNLEQLAQDLAKLSTQPLPVGSLTLTEPKPGENASLAEALASAVNAGADTWASDTNILPQEIKELPNLTHLARLRHDQLPPLQLSVTASPATHAADLTKILASVLEPYTVEARSTADPGRFDLFLVKSTAFSCADFLALTDALQPRFDALVNASRRPGAYLTGDYGSPLSMPIPKFRPTRQVTRCLALRLQAHLMSGQADKAIQDLAVLNAVRNTLAKPELTLVASMIDTVLQGKTFDAIQTGFSRHAWRAEDLAKLEAHAQSSKPTATVFKALHCERLWSVWLMEAYDGNTGGGGKTALSALGSSASSSENLLALIPSGWVKQNVANVVRPVSAVIDSYDTARGIVSMEKYAFSQKLVTEEVEASGPYHYLSKMALPAFERVVQQSARTQTQAGLTVLGCALERHLLDTGAYPEKLESLIPKYLTKAPVQTVNGDPFLYRRETDGGYSLWSIGWDLKDDGGKFAVGDKVDEAKADWGWRMARSAN